jgi:hypothetical protein
VGKSEMLREAILQNFGSREAPGNVLDALSRLVDARGRHRLVYDDLNEAADLLERRFT